MHTVSKREVVLFKEFNGRGKATFRAFTMTQAIAEND